MLRRCSTPRTPPVAFFEYCRDPTLCCCNKILHDTHVSTVRGCGAVAERPEEHISGLCSNRTPVSGGIGTWLTMIEALYLQTTPRMALIAQLLIALVVCALTVSQCYSCVCPNAQLTRRVRHSVAAKSSATSSRSMVYSNHGSCADEAHPPWATTSLHP